MSVYMDEEFFDLKWLLNKGLVKLASPYQVHDVLTYDQQQRIIKKEVKATVKNEFLNICPSLGTDFTIGFGNPYPLEKYLSLVIDNDRSSLGVGLTWELVCGLPKVTQDFGVKVMSLGAYDLDSAKTLGELLKKPKNGFVMMLNFPPLHYNALLNDETVRSVMVESFGKHLGKVFPDGGRFGKYTYRIPTKRLTLEEVRGIVDCLRMDFEDFKDDDHVKQLLSELVEEEYSSAKSRLLEKQARQLAELEMNYRHIE